MLSYRLTTFGVRPTSRLFVQFSFTPNIRSADLVREQWSQLSALITDIVESVNTIRIFTASLPSSRLLLCNLWECSSCAVLCWHRGLFTPFPALFLRVTSRVALNTSCLRKCALFTQKCAGSRSICMHTVKTHRLFRGKGFYSVQI